LKSNSKSLILFIIALGILFTLIPIITTNLGFISIYSNKGSEYSSHSNLESVKISQQDVLYSENFNDGVADNWETIGGNWTVENQQYKVTGIPGERVRSYYSYQTFSNYIYEGDFNLVSGDEMQIIFNVQDIFAGIDQGHYCQFTLFYDSSDPRNNSVILYSTQNYQSTHKVEPYDFINDKWYHFEVVSSEADVDFFINGSLILSFSGVFYTSGFIGVKAMFGPTAYWDNIVVRKNLEYAVPGYNLFFLLSYLSLIALILSKEVKKTLNLTF